jgi:hypothetical protein
LRIQHLEEQSLVFRFEILGGDSTHPDLQFGIYIGLIWGLLPLGRIIEGFSLLLERGFSGWGFGIAYGLDLYLYSVFIVYPTFGGL